MKILLKRAVTLLELLVVLAIISILSTIAVGVYTNQIAKARFAKARAEIRMLETAIVQYQIDVGKYPPSGSGIDFSPNPLTIGLPAYGSGYLQMALRSSLNGNMREPLDSRWGGPYIEWEYNRLGIANADGTVTQLSPTAFTQAPGSFSMGELSLLDPWGGPYSYVSSETYYTHVGATLPATSPFEPFETWYNPTTFQIISGGPNRATGVGADRGKEPDDVTNFFGSNF